MTNPEAVVQAQLDAYNAHDVEALVAIYADDAEQFQHPATPMARGAAQLRARFSARFAESRPRAQLLNRIVAGNIVIDHEHIHSQFPEGAGRQEMVATYEVVDGRIARAWFIIGARTPNALNAPDTPTAPPAEPAP
jgi:hypothetical protein